LNLSTGTATIQTNTRMAEDKIFDELLVIRSQGGDKQALLLLINRWNKKMLSKANILTGDYEASKDIVQECWHAIIRGLNKLNDPSRFGPWVYRIVQGKSVDWIRQKQRSRKVFSENVQTEDLPSFSITSLVEESESETDLAVRKLRAALSKLTGDQRFLLSLHYLENQSLQDISQVLLIPLGTVKSRLFHARKVLLTTFKKLKPLENE